MINKIIYTDLLFYETFTFKFKYEHPKKTILIFQTSELVFLDVHF